MIFILMTHDVWTVPLVDIQPKFAALRECRLCNRHRDELSSEWDNDDFEVCLACNTSLADSRATLRAVQQVRTYSILGTLCM